MKINLFLPQTFQLIKQTVNRILTPQQQMICAVAVLALSCLATAYLLLRCCFKEHLVAYDPEFEKGLNTWVTQEGGQASKAANRIKTAYYNKRPTLTLSSLNLKSLPSEIIKLENLVLFLCDSNELETLPEFIANLKLIYINLSNNKFENLPESMGNLLGLQFLNLTNNPIHSLPISLGHCSELTTIDCEKTNIPFEIRDTILAMCQALRAKEALKILPTRLKAWQAVAGQTFALDFIENLPAEKQIIINEWLTRLERTHDFSMTSHQKKLAKRVSQMLESLEKSPSFQEIFFIQVPINLVACGDRAAMSFNELGLAWTCDNLFLSTLSEKEKLNTLMQAAKTLALHHALQKRIAEHEKKTSTKIEEDVEIYLYYETHLKEKLNLLTFMSDMLYSAMGKCDWINEAMLINEVNKSYKERLFDFPTLSLMCKADAKFNTDWQEIEDDLYKEMEKIKPSDLKEWEYKLQMDKFAQKLENQKRALMLDWVKNKLAT